MINNSNILDVGSSLSGDSLLEFYSKYKNHTTAIELVVSAPGLSREIICPDGTWCWELNAMPNVGAIVNPPAEFLLLVNGQPISLQNKSDDNKIPFAQLFKKPGTPYIQVLDNIQIQNNNFTGKFQFIFHRIMLKDQ